MPSWKKILQSGSAIHVLNITASNLPQVSQPHILGYNSQSGIFTYFSTSSLVGGGSVIGGSGNQNYITRWDGSTTITNSSIYENGGNIGIGTTNPSYKLDVGGQTRSHLHNSTWGVPVIGSYFSDQKPLELRLHPDTWTNKLAQISLPNIGVYTSSNGTTWVNVKGTGYGGNSNGNLNNLFRGDKNAGINLPAPSTPSDYTYYRVEVTASYDDESYYNYIDEISVEAETQYCTGNLQIYALRYISASNPTGPNAWYTASNPDINGNQITGWPTTYFCKLNESLPLSYAGGYKVLRFDFRIQTDTSYTNPPRFIIKKIRGMSGYLSIPTDNTVYRNKGYLYDGNGTLGVFPLYVLAPPTGSAVIDAAWQEFYGTHVRLPGRIFIGAAGVEYPQIMYNAVPATIS